MNTFHIFLFLLISFQSVYAQTGMNDYRQTNPRSIQVDKSELDNDKLAGVYYLYPFDNIDRVTPPKGFTPVYISHYGRHGARYVLTDREYDNVYNVLVSSHNACVLNDRGEELYRQYIALYPSFYKRAGDLTTIGQEQHRLIAKRMTQTYPEIFRSQAIVEAQSTTVPRCIMSMASFCQGLQDNARGVDISMSTSKSYLSYLNPYNIENPKVFKGDADSKSSYSKRMMDEFFEANIDVRAFIDRYYADSRYALAHYNMDLFMQDLFMVASDMQCLSCDDLSLSKEDIKSLGLDDTERRTNFFFDYFSREEILYLWEWENMRFYIEKGPSLTTDGRSYRLSESLLDELIKRTDSDLALGTPQVRLRFGHDACIMGLYCLMGLDGWGHVTSCPDSVKYCWQSYNIPMAANLQIIFYRNSKGEVIFRFLHNEHDLTLPLDEYRSNDRIVNTGNHVRFYLWDDFKSMYEPIVRDAARFIDLSGKATIYGQVTVKGKPIGGIAISDGVSISITDSRGYYFIESSKVSGKVYILPSSRQELMTEESIDRGWIRRLAKPSSERERVDFVIN